MTIEEIKTEMTQLKSRVEQLGRELQQAEIKCKTDEVPETLDWDDDEHYYYSTIYGKRSALYTAKRDEDAAQNHTIFKTEEFSEIFRDKTQFIADLLHFKWLYDRDYVPDLNDDNSYKWFVLYNNCQCKYDISNDSFLVNIETVYFSSEKIAQKCADWLNNRNTRNKND